VPSARRCAHWTIPIGVAAAPVSRSYIDRRRAATPSSLSLKLLTNNSYAPDASGLSGCTLLPRPAGELHVHDQHQRGLARCANFCWICLMVRMRQMAVHPASGSHLHSQHSQHSGFSAVGAG
jgi:hypothetical protein